ncbi:endonuclease MutS2 [Lyngbya confervoides BDU141951]|uniref:Endonuclease MutS2 n=1 Tax=Lyngbya confervoides BDU141951 TaxID=1574623 RepID=A0ABD4T735_9CYAN|nr:endonuclease MutS2 [Lyngbya confervoides]MCM1984268.1 endonuclease MutS2 [Lyngbya confervoides BDU141951]
MTEKTLELIEWPQLCQQVSTFASTSLGARAAQHLPLATEPAGSQALLAQTQEIVALEVDYLAPLKFEGIADIGESLARAERQGVLSGLELWQIATSLAGARSLRRTIDQYPDLETLGALIAPLRTYPELEKQICHCIDEQGEVMERASEKLGALRAERARTYQQLQHTLQTIIQRRAPALQEPLITQRGDRFVLPVKATRKDEVPGIVHDISTSGATLYIEPRKTVEMNNQLRALLRREQMECEAIRRDLSEQVAAVKPDLEQLLDIVTILDIAAARARYSLHIGGFCPVWKEATPGPAVMLRQLRHPLLVWQAQQSEDATVVPIDLVIQPHTKVVAITGPNTGGKTVTLKTLALAITMAKAGLFIPARDPVTLLWFDQVLADIGDEQSLQQSLSTFSGHVKRIQQILTQATSESLVLLDEVGAGTDPSEGSALATALLRYLADHVRLTVATTHFGELKTLKYQDDRFENASVEFDDRSLSPTYRLLWGIPGRSNALIIAERLGFNPDIIEQAQQLMGGKSDEFNQVISSLEQQRREQEEKAQEAAQLLSSSENLYRQLEQKAAQLRDREQSLKQQQEQELQQELAAAKQNIAQVIRKLQRGPQTAQAAHRATQTLEAIAQTLQPQTATLQPQGFKPQVGDRVRLPKLGQTAEVIAPVTSAGEVTVRFGLMKMTLGLEDVESLSGEKAQPSPKSPPKRESPPPDPASPDAPMIRTSKNTLDLRGQRVADAELAMDEAIAQIQGPLWIIHGHGTGKLRKGVQDYLKAHPQVDRFEFAAPAEGGRGVTIAHCR